MSRVIVRSLAAVALAAAASVGHGADPGPRPRMLQLEAATVAGRPPSPRELVDARAVVERRFREPLARAGSAAGANAATAALLEAAPDEPDAAVKWIMLAEARRLAAAAGNAAAVDRAIVLADAAFEFDALAEEHRMLSRIPLQALDPVRAATLAEVAEGLAQRAAADGRRDVAADSWELAIRGWQRAGNAHAARRAATLRGTTARRTTRR